MRRCKGLGPFCRGFRAFRAGMPRVAPMQHTADCDLWSQGWDFAKEKAE